MNIVANYAIGQTKKLTPVGVYKAGSGKTGGTLRRSWSRSDVSYTSKALVVKISNDQDYASFVENGHRTRGGKSWVKGRFMLKNALEITEEQKLNATAQKELDGYLKKLLGG